MKSIKMFVVSDSVGETAELVAKAAASQFPNTVSIAIKRFSNIEDETQIKEIVQLAKREKAIIVYTLVRSEIKEVLDEWASTLQVEALDLMGPLLQLIEQRVGERPVEEPGLVRQLDDDYFKKIEAIEFAVKYDDGRDPRGILQADIVLLGISRTSKTPLSQYLAHQRLKVANVPLVPEVEPPEELNDIDPRRCFGLVISSRKLNQIRKERLKSLGLHDSASYAQIDRIDAEIAHFEKVTAALGCEVIDVTNRAVEETASIIIEHWIRHFRSM